MSRAAILLLAALCLGGASYADEEAASYFAGRGAKAEGNDKWAEARSHYLKSLAELDGYVPALLGLARVAHAEGNAGEAVERLEACLAQPESRTLGRDERTALAAAKQLLEKIDRPRSELRRIQNDYITALMALARQSAKTKPLVARECAERVLKLSPVHPSARELLTTLPGSPAASRRPETVCGTARTSRIGPAARPSGRSRTVFYWARPGTDRTGCALARK